MTMRPPAVPRTKTAALSELSEECCCSARRPVRIAFAVRSSLAMIPQKALGPSLFRGSRWNACAGNSP
jgi:hypothetical protein